ncbi:MAG TPA: NAD(P)H-binding protein [Myxococcales bacterium]|nr:NAD(P)H-binding protein [Myxococcales bacterium]
MRIAVFGATGATGRRVVTETLRQGHAAWAFTRRREGWLLGKPGLLPVVGDLQDASAVTRALAARDAVIVTLGHREDSPSDLLERAVERILQGMSLHRVKRLIYLSALGVGDSRDVSGVYGRLLRPLFYARAHRDHEKAEALIRSSGLSWTIVRPPRLTDGPSTGYEVNPLRLGLAAHLPRVDLARFLVDQLRSDAHVWSAPLVTAAAASSRALAPAAAA